jgi:hypothetical protein
MDAQAHVGWIRRPPDPAFNRNGQFGRERALPSHPSRPDSPEWRLVTEVLAQGQLGPFVERAPPFTEADGGGFQGAVGGRGHLTLPLVHPF